MKFRAKVSDIYVSADLPVNEPEYSDWDPSFSGDYGSQFIHLEIRNMELVHDWDGFVVIGTVYEQ